MSRYDVVGVGNAIVDVIVLVDDEFIDEHQLTKGAMTLIDAERATSLYDAMPAGIEASGGSAANTMAGIASFGGRAAYIGKVRDDQLGEVFRHDIRATGVSYDVPFGTDGPPTARCLIQVTPDAQRTMNTFLGISSLLSPADVDEQFLRLVFANLGGDSLTEQSTKATCSESGTPAFARREMVCSCTAKRGTRCALLP